MERHACSIIRQIIRDRDALNFTKGSSDLRPLRSEFSCSECIAVGACRCKFFNFDKETTGQLLRIPGEEATLDIKKHRRIMLRRWCRGRRTRGKISPKLIWISMLGGSWSRCRCWLRC